MSFASPDIAYTSHPRDALLRAHLKSSVSMAVYLIGGTALAITAFVAFGVAQQLSSAWALLPHAVAASTLLWVGLGAVVIHLQKQQLERDSIAYSAHVKRHAQNTPGLSAPQPASDAPWELHAFWNPCPKGPSTMKQPLYTNAHSSNTTTACTDFNAATTLEVDLIASMTEHKPLRPISLFGSVQ